MHKTLTYFASTFFVLTACGKVPANQSSQTKALVSEEQAANAFEIVSKMDYIPFNFIIDGCYARSLYMSMELAAESIPSSAHYIFGYLQPTATVSWGYHVAPLLQIDNDEPWILDPAFEVEPLRLSEWVEKNNSQTQFSTELKAGSAYFDQTGRTSEFNNGRMIQNFEEMPTFLTSDIVSACTTMYNYIGELNQSYFESRRMRFKLLSRTTELVKSLTELGKLEDTGSSFDANNVCNKAVGL